MERPNWLPSCPVRIEIVRGCSGLHFDKSENNLYKGNMEKEKKQKRFCLWESLLFLFIKINKLALQFVVQ